MAGALRHTCKKEVPFHLLLFPVSMTTLNVAFTRMLSLECNVSGTHDDWDTKHSRNRPLTFA